MVRNHTEIVQFQCLGRVAFGEGFRRPLTSSEVLDFSVLLLYALPFSISNQKQSSLDMHVPDALSLLGCLWKLRPAPSMS